MRRITHHGTHCGRSVGERPLRERARRAIGPLPPEVLRLQRALQHQPLAATNRIKARYRVIPREAFSVEDVIGAAQAA
jgi:hypothetical protein